MVNRFRESAERQEGGGLFRRLTAQGEGEARVSATREKLREMQRYGGALGRWYSDLIGAMQESGNSPVEIAAFIRQGWHDGGLPPIVRASVLGSLEDGRGLYRSVLDLSSVNVGIAPQLLQNGDEIRLVTLTPHGGLPWQVAFEQLVIDEELEKQYDQRDLEDWSFRIRDAYERLT